jgi:hypothetical protein
MNKLLVVVIVMAVLGLPAAFVAGLTVAVSFEGGGSSAEILKTFLGSVGDWVSGLGALAAAVIAIYLADKQRRDSLPQIHVRQGVEAREIRINLVSVGDRSVHILAVYLRSRKLDGRARLVSSRDLPKTLEYGGILPITADRGRCGNFSNFISRSDDHCDLPDLEIVVEASTRTFIVPVDREVIDFIEGHRSMPDGLET